MAPKLRVHDGDPGTSKTKDETGKSWHNHKNKNINEDDNDD